MELSVCRSKHRELSLQDLPSEILVDIFLKLPVKCLISMKCANKHWWAVISDPRFIELQFEKAVKNPGHLYIFLKESPPYIYLAERVSDCTEAMKIPRAALYQRIAKYQKNPAMNWSTSGGLVAILMRTENCCYICNPILGEEIKVTMGPYFGKKMFQMVWWGFGYSFSTKEYKLIFFATPISKEGRTQEEKEVVLGAIYTLGSESWREIPEVPFTPEDRRQVDCDGTLFWLIFYDSGEEVVRRSHSIASFDIGSEEFRLWKGPNTDMDEESCRALYLTRVGDTVGCVMMMNDRSLGIWILRDKVNEFWNMEYTFAQSRVHVLGLWMNRDLFCYEAPHLFTYDSNNKQFRAKLQLPFHEEYPDWVPHHGVIRTHVLCLISPWRTKAMGNKLIGISARNSITLENIADFEKTLNEGNNKCKFFFEWADLATCERGNDFGNWIVRRKLELEKNIEELPKQMEEMDFGFRVRMNQWQKMEEWYLMKMNCVIKRMNDMEAEFALKVEEWKNKEDWHGLEREEVVEKNEALELKMEEVVEKNEALKLKMDKVAARNDVLVKRNKAMQDEVKLAKLKMVVLIAMVVILVGIGIVFLGGRGMWDLHYLSLTSF